MKAPFSYYGGKSGMTARVLAVMPPHRVYIEPYFGSGSVFFRKPPAVHEIVNDLDDVVFRFFRVLRDRRAELEEVCALSLHSRSEFEAAKFLPDEDLSVLDDLEVARRFWVRVNQSFNKSSGNQTGFSVTTGRTQSVPASIAGRLGRFEACAERLRATTIERADGARLVSRFATVDSVVYADPPYLADTRRSRRSGTACADYRVDMGNPEEHERLAEVLLACKGTVFLAGYPSALYDKWFADWDRRQWQTHAHGSNLAARGGRTEVLWSNRPIELPPQGTLGFDSDEMED